MGEEKELKWKKFPVLDDGFVTLVDVMGNDSAVVQAARVSYGEGTKKINEDRGLIRYLMRHYHTTPLEMCEVKLLVRVPMDGWRQWIRHRTANVNEYSTRYSIAIDSAQGTPAGEWRAQDKTVNRQGSLGIVPDEWPAPWKIENREYTDEDGTHVGPCLIDHEGDIVMEDVPDGYTVQQFLEEDESFQQKSVRASYERRIALGVAREQARKDLPLSTYTEAYWKCDLHNILNFLRLRMDSHAQKEIRDYAKVIGEQIIAPLFPLVWEAFVDFRLNAMSLSGLEIELLQRLNVCANKMTKTRLLNSEYSLMPGEWKPNTLNGKLVRHGERDEAIEKMIKLEALNPI